MEVRTNIDDILEEYGEGETISYYTALARLLALLDGNTSTLILIDFGIDRLKSIHKEDTPFLNHKEKK